MKIVVVGAGAFGGWLALFLLRKGFDVILVDGHGAGNARSSSGDETRVIRSVYKDEIYARFTQRSMQIWKKHEADKKERLLFPAGVLNIIGRDESRWLAAKHHLDKLGIYYDLMDTKTLVNKYPCISPLGISYGHRLERPCQGRSGICRRSGGPQLHLPDHPLLRLRLYLCHPPASALRIEGQCGGYHHR